MVHPSYEELEQALVRVDAVHEPAEVHGILCGLLVHQSSIPVDTFVGIILGKVDDGDGWHVATWDVEGEFAGTITSIRIDPVSWNGGAGGPAAMMSKKLMPEIDVTVVRKEPHFIVR